MTKEKQIEEMTKITCSMYCRDKEKKCAGIQECDMKCLHYQRCEALYNAGYRKQIEGEWIFKEYSEDTYTNLTRIYECSLCGRTIECLNEADEPYCHCGAKMKGGAE